MNSIHKKKHFLICKSDIFQTCYYFSRFFFERFNFINFFLVDFEPLSLQTICRSVIRTILRNNIDIEHPDLKKKNEVIPKKIKKKCALKRLVVPIFEESDIETSDNLTDEDDRHELGRVRLSPDRGNGQGGREFNTILDLVLGLGSCRNDNENTDEQNQENTEDNENNESSTSNPTEVLKMEEDETKNKKTGNNKREKFDSGLGEDLLNEKHSSDSEIMEVDSDSEENSSYSGDNNSKSKRIQYARVPSLIHAGGKFKKVSLRSYTVDSDSDSDMLVEEPQPRPVQRTVYVSPYTKYLRAKIQALPLPPLLKQYLNFYREFN